VIGYDKSVLAFKSILSSNQKPFISDILLGIKDSQHMNPKPPPHICIGSLEKFRKYDYCCWAIIGRIEFIKCLSVTMRCSKCLNYSINVQNGYSLVSNRQYNCEKCLQPLLLVPVWLGNICVDDGTGVCTVTCEGSVMTDILRIICGANNQILSDFIDEMEAQAWMKGSVRLDTFSVLRNYS
jgi:hypothetical protein